MLVSMEHMETKQTLILTDSVKKKILIFLQSVR